MRLPRAAWMPPLSALALVLLFNAILANFFQIDLYLSGYLAEFLVGTAFAYWLYALLRPWWVFLAVQTCAVGLLYFSNAYKMQYFAAPVMPADITVLPVLFQQFFGWRFLLIAAPFAALTLFLLAGLRWRWRTPLLLLGGVLLVAGLMRLAPDKASQSMDRIFGYAPFGARYNFYARGPTLYLLNEYLRARAVLGEVPGQDQVVAALRQIALDPPLPRPADAAPRNIYVFMMETLWDASLLKAAHFSRDPLAPAFRQLYEQSGESKALVPVFGGGTANSEFEALCGEPAYDNAIVFVTTLRHPMLCLPRLLAQAGYHTDAATPDGYGIWNRGNVFRLLGFQRFYDADNFDPDDRNGGFMADSALFEQLDVLLSKEGLPGPRFLYVSTDAGHYPFELNTAKRPALIKSADPDPLVGAYGNTVYYDTAELAAYIARIRARDPDAVIAAFGDHLPALGDGGNVPFHRSGLMGLHEDEFSPQMLEVHQSTPLLVIDGRRGPLKLGHISLFELPRLLLSLAGVHGATELDAFAPPSGLHPRIRSGRLLVVPDAGEPGYCTPESRDSACLQVNRWFGIAQVLRADIVGGDDYATGLLYGEPARALAMPPSGGAYLSSVNPSLRCDMRVTAWEPQATAYGRGFNLTPDNHSTFHIRYAGDARRLRLWLGFEELEVNRTGDGQVDAVLTGRLPLFLPGDHALEASCNGDPHRIAVGEFHVGL